MSLSLSCNANKCMVLVRAGDDWRLSQIYSDVQSCIQLNKTSKAMHSRQLKSE